MLYYDKVMYIHIQLHCYCHQVIFIKNGVFIFLSFPLSFFLSFFLREKKTPLICRNFIQLQTHITFFQSFCKKKENVREISSAFNTSARICCTRHNTSRDYINKRGNKRNQKNCLYIVFSIMKRKRRYCAVIKLTNENKNEVYGTLHRTQRQPQTCNNTC